MSMSRPGRLACLALLLALTALLPAAAAEDPGQALGGHYQGTITLPAAPLVIDVDLTLAADGTGSGDITIPTQGVRDLALGDIARDGDEVTFKITALPGDPTFSGKVAEGGRKISGIFTQGGGSFPFELTSAPAGAGSAEAYGAILAGLDPFVDRALADWQVPGLALAVVADGAVVLAKGYGRRDIEGGQPVTPRTVFPIGSSTKAFTTFVLASLVEEGKLSWDKPVASFLPGFALYDPHASAEITPRDLVTHRSGLPRHDGLWYNNFSLSRKELVARLPYLPNNETLRARFQYNNLMYLTAGYLIEHLTGRSWEDNVRERIWMPLGMTSSSFSVADAQKAADFAYAYDERDGKLTRIPFREIGNIGPAGSINSNLDDMARWVQVHLSGGKVGARQLLSPATIAELHAPQMVLGTPARDRQISPASYTLGWFTDTYRGIPRVYHGGNIDGFSALVTLLPQQGMGIVVLTNRNSTGLPEQVVRYVSDRLLGLPPIDWYAEATARRRQSQGIQKESEARKDLFRKAGTRPSHPLADYAGNYEHKGYGLMKVALAGGRLEMTYNGITTPLSHHHYDVFRADKAADPTFADTLVLFTSSPGGYVSGLSLPMEPTVPDTVFTRKPDARWYDPAYLARFVGDYELGFMSVQISLSGNTLIALPTGQTPSPLEPDLGDELVAVKQRSSRVRFKEDEKGKVVGLYLLQEGEGVLEGKRKP